MSSDIVFALRWVCGTSENGYFVAVKQMVVPMMADF